MCRESSFLVKPPATLRFSLIRFSQGIFLANQWDWIHIVLHNWSVEGGGGGGVGGGGGGGGGGVGGVGGGVENWKYDSFYALFLIDERW